jgi:NAD(P)-dependent dehydrogenase (short-subunit alcohol dehydrogenase family)
VEASLTWVVTGANRGLGAEFVRQLGARDGHVIGAARPELDVTDDASVAAFAESLQGRPVDVLINNAGRQNRASTLEEFDFPEQLDTLDVNALGPMRVLRALLPNLRAGRAKKVVHVTSRMGSFLHFGANMYGYRASKAALNMYHRCVAEELAPGGFVCIALHPGWVRTDMGGSDATLGVEESVAGMLQVIDRLGPGDNGAFLDYTGSPIGW